MNVVCNYYDCHGNVLYCFLMFPSTMRLSHQSDAECKQAPLPMSTCSERSIKTTQTSTSQSGSSWSESSELEQRDTRRHAKGPTDDTDDVGTYTKWARPVGRELLFCRFVLFFPNSHNFIMCRPMLLYISY